MLNFYKVRTPIILLLFSIIYLSGCSVFNSQDCCEDNCERYVFHFPWEVNGVDEFAQLGDTITFTSLFSHDVVDQTYGDTYSLKNYELPILFALSKLDTNGCNADYRNFTSYVEVLANNVQVSNLGEVRLTQFDYEYNNNIYRSVIKLVFNKRGFYLVNIDKADVESLVNDGRANQFKGYCKARTQYVRFPFDEDKRLDENWNLFESINTESNPFCFKYQQKEDFTEGSYIFEVR